MKTKILVCGILLLILSKSYSQDTIYTNSGKKVICEITSEDSSNVYFTTIINNQNVKTQIQKESIQRISYNKLLESQNWDSDSIIGIKKEHSTEYYYHRQKLSTKELEKILFKRYSPREFLDDSKAHHAVAMALGLGGGFLIGYPIGAVISGETPNWGMAAIGAVCILVSLPLEFKSQHCQQKAVDAYNKEIAAEKEAKNANVIEIDK